MWITSSLHDGLVDVNLSNGPSVVLTSHLWITHLCIHLNAIVHAEKIASLQLLEQVQSAAGTNALISF